MTNTELISKIKAEIERHINELDISDESILIEAELSELLSFLSTLESEKPMNQDGLEEAVVDYFEGYWPGMETAEQCNTDLRFTPPAIMRLARHFYELGCRRTAEKFDEIEYNRQREEERVPNDLEEAADNHIREVADAGWEWTTQDIAEAFKAGAEWATRRDEGGAVEISNRKSLKTTNPPFCSHEK